MRLLELKSISKNYGSGNNSTPVLHDVSFKVERGDFIAIMGPSGSGKSTLMNIIGLLDVASHGSYLFEDTDTSKLGAKQQANLRKNKIGFIFQSFNLLSRQSAIENIMLPMVYKGNERFKREGRAHDLLEQVGLVDRGLFNPNQLSGGQKQRIAIARALANKPSLVLADEPTGNLDTDTGKKILHLLSELNKAGNTIIMVTHDKDIARHAKRIITLVDGKIVDDWIAVSEKTKPETKSKAKKSANKKTKENKDEKTKSKKDTETESKTKDKPVKPKSKKTKIIVGSE